MLNKGLRLTAFRVSGSASTINRWFYAGGIMFVLAAFSVGGAVPAFARTKYDGKWSVLILTRRGACEPAIRYGVEIANGIVSSTDSDAATVRGRVGSTGAVSVSVRSGSEWARGSGRLDITHGSGAWEGQGTSGTCHGAWVAQRRSYGLSANETSVPRYYNRYQ